MQKRKNFQQIGIYSIISCIFGAIIIINYKTIQTTNSYETPKTIVPIGIIIGSSIM